MAVGVKFDNTSGNNDWGTLGNWKDATGAFATTLPNGTTNVTVTAEVDSDSTGSFCLCASATFTGSATLFTQSNYYCIFKGSSMCNAIIQNNAAFYENSGISIGDGGGVTGTVTIYSSSAAFNILLSANNNTASFAGSLVNAIPAGGGGSFGVPLARLLRLPFPVNL